MTRALHLACLTGQYPVQSELFLQRDLTALAGAGHTVHIWPVLESAASGRARWHLPDGTPLPPVMDRTVSRASWATGLRALARCGLLQIRRLPLLLRQIDLLPARPDLVLACFGNLPAVYARALAAMVEIPFAVLFHARDVWQPFRPGLRAAAEAGVIVTCNQAAREGLQFHLPQHLQKMHTIPHYLPTELFQEPRQPSGSALILAAGRFVAKKGFSVLLRAFQQVLETVPDASLQLIGDGPEEQALRRLRSSLKLTPEQVRIRGWLSPAELREQMARAAVVVQPSIIAPDGDRDGIPNILLEAMAMAKPVIGTATGAIPELIQDGRTGFLAGAGDPEDLSRALTRCLCHSEDAAALGQAAREHVCLAHSPGNTWQKLETLLIDLASAKNPVTP